MALLGGSSVRVGDVACACCTVLRNNPVLLTFSNVPAILITQRQLRWSDVTLATFDADNGSKDDSTKNGAFLPKSVNRRRIMHEPRRRAVANARGTDGHADDADI